MLLNSVIQSSFSWEVGDEGKFLWRTTTVKIILWKSCWLRKDKTKFFMAFFAEVESGTIGTVCKRNSRKFNRLKAVEFQNNFHDWMSTYITSDIFAAFIHNSLHKISLRFQKSLLFIKSMRWCWFVMTYSTISSDPIIMPILSWLRLWKYKNAFTNLHQEITKWDCK
jgi:hypothetical protein